MKTHIIGKEVKQTDRAGLDLETFFKINTFLPEAKKKSLQQVRCTNTKQTVFSCAKSWDNVRKMLKAQKKSKSLSLTLLSNTFQAEMFGGSWKPG